MAVKSVFVDVVKHLLEESTLDVNAVDKLKNTALHVAAAAKPSEANEEIMFLLLSHPKINLALTNKEGKTTSDLNPNCNMTWRDKRAAVKTEIMDPVVSSKRGVVADSQPSPPRKRQAFVGAISAEPGLSKLKAGRSPAFYQTNQIGSKFLQSNNLDDDDDSSIEGNDQMQFEATQKQSRNEEQVLRPSSSASHSMHDIARRTLSQLDEKEKELERQMKELKDQREFLVYSIQQMETNAWH
jgi:hypothetical protein